MKIKNNWPKNSVAIETCTTQQLSRLICRRMIFAQEEGWPEISEVTKVVPTMTNMREPRISMARLVRIITAAVFAFHVMVGCCFHHAHASDCSCQTPTSKADATPDGQCPCSQNHDEHQGQHDCQGVKCSFVRTANVTISKSLLMLCQATAVSSTGDVPASRGVSCEQHSLFTARFLWPVRLHLVNQVLMI